MNVSAWIRQIHRILSIAFTLGFIVNFFAWQGEEPAAWVAMLALVPLILLLLTGLYLFALPYLGKRGRG